MDSNQFQSRPELSRCRILVVDDEQANIDLLCSVLEDDGFVDVTCTRDPREAIDLYGSLSPDLVLLDLHMPHLSGFAVMEGIGKLRAPDDFVPILVLTADINPETRLRALSQGATDFLSKPLDTMELTLRIRNLLTMRILQRQQQEARMHAEAEKRRAEFLSEVSRALGASLDAQTTLAMIPSLAVPRHADYCVIELNDDAETRKRVGATHRDEDGEKLLLQGSALWQCALPHGHAGIGEVARGKSLLLQRVNPEELAANAGTAGEQDALRSLVPRSVIIVPLMVSGRVAGALTLAMSTSDRIFDADDLALAEELMRRANGAHDNARLYDDAQRATRARDRILAVVAHDLRNPLNTINMVADMILEDAGVTEHRSHLEMVRRATGHMNELIQNLLDASRADGGKPALDPCPESVGDLVTEAATMLAPLADARAIALETEIEEGLPPIMADATRLLQVISNLVGNALKFTDKGGRIQLRSTADEGAVHFAVADTGSGIAPEQLPHIFGAFWQAAPDDRRGIGLGLSIAQGIVEAHGGRIWVESERGQGTTFHFTIPTADVTMPANAVQSELVRA